MLIMYEMMPKYDGDTRHNTEIALCKTHERKINHDAAKLVVRRPARWVANNFGNDMNPFF